MKYGLITLALSLSVLLSSELYADDITQKVCNLTVKESHKIAEGGESKGLNFCKKGDVIVFKTSQHDATIIVQSMARVCDVSSIALSVHRTSIGGLCVYTGNTLALVKN